MGHRLHIAKKFDVEYDDSAYFNWQYEAFKNLLDYNEVWIENGADHFDIDKKDFKKIIKSLQGMNSVEFNKLGFNDSKSKVKKDLQEIYNKSDPNNDFVFIYWY